MSFTKRKKRVKMLALAVGVLSFLFIVFCVAGIYGGSTTAYAHSGNTDANGGHYEHTQACRNANYNTSHSGCTYHYHSSGSSSNEISDGWTSSNGSGGSSNQSGGFEIPKVSDEQMQAYLKNAMEKLEAENAARAREQYVGTTNSNGGDSSGGITAIVIVSLSGVGLLASMIYKRKSA